MLQLHDTRSPDKILYQQYSISSSSRSHAHVLLLAALFFQEIWHEFDAEGNGVTAEGLGGVVTGMMHAGVIRLSAEGHIIPVHTAHVHRKRGTTGMVGHEGHVVS